MRARALHSLAIAALLLAGSSCRGQTSPPGRASDPPRAAAAEVDNIHAGGHAPDARAAEIERVADAVMAQARAREPAVSAELLRLAAELGGRLAGFEHRLKTRGSCLRKMRKKLAENPVWTPREAALDDALRYTLEVADEPRGRYAHAIRLALARFEAAGHRVIQVKNYWPRGDNYSGVNTVLVAPGGLRWELQFHTPESFRVKMRDHHLYEELRETQTTAARKRQLYLQLAAPWSALPIPKEMLDPKALHRTEEIILRPPPDLPSQGLGALPSPSPPGSPGEGLGALPAERAP